MATLFDPIKVGDYKLKNRIFMAPLTRGRSGVDGVPNEMVAEYYAHHRNNDCGKKRDPCRDEMSEWLYRSLTLMLD